MISMSTFHGVRLTAALLAAALFAAEPESVLLKPKFTPGESHFLQVSQEIEQSVRGGRFGETGRVTNIQHLRTIQQTVESVSDGGGVKLAFVVDRVKRTSDTLMGLAAFDSDVDRVDDPSNPLAVIFRPMLGRTLTLDVGKDLSVGPLTGWQAYLDGVEETAAGGIVFEPMRDELSESSMRFLLGEARLAMYAGKEVRAGDGWTRSIRYSSLTMGEVLYEYRCRMDGVKVEDGRKQAIIHYEVDIRRAPGSPPPPSIMATVTEFDTGHAAGTAVFDVERGLIVQESEESLIQFRATGPGPSPDRPSITRFERKTKQTITLKRQNVKTSKRRKRLSGFYFDALTP